ncbi:hypothetical protein SDC9_145257 [bioreactor metagenome]|uniref:Uncharacterized protein n=1 Tax=bioreactor metagenome TaxID=1076179 RepID=A0A645E900_9ZZZZ
MLPCTQFIPDFVQFLPDQFQRKPCADQEFIVLPEHLVDIALTVKTPVHHQVDFADIQIVQLFEQVADRPDVRDVSRKLPVAYGEHRSLAVQQGKVDLWQQIMFLVVSVSDLPERLGIGRDARDVIEQILCFRPPLALHPEELLPAVLSNRLEQVADAL